MASLVSFANISILGTAYTLIVSKGVAFLPFPKRENWNVARIFLKGVQFLKNYLTSVVSSSGKCLGFGRTKSVKLDLCVIILYTLIWLIWLILKTNFYLRWFVGLTLLWLEQQKTYFSPIILANSSKPVLYRNTTSKWNTWDWKYITCAFKFWRQKWRNVT